MLCNLIGKKCYIQHSIRSYTKINAITYLHQQWSVKSYRVISAWGHHVTDFLVLQESIIISRLLKSLRVGHFVGLKRLIDI